MFPEWNVYKPCVELLFLWRELHSSQFHQKIFTFLKIQPKISHADWILCLQRWRCYRIKIQCIFQSFPVYILTNICSNSTYILYMLACYYYKDLAELAAKKPVWFDLRSSNTQNNSWSEVRNEINYCTHSLFTEVNAKYVQIPALRESGYWTKPVVCSVTENFTVLLRTKCHDVL